MLRCYNIKVLKNEHDNFERFYCKVCNYPLATQQDFNSNLKFTCCHDCYLTFVEPDITAWKKGIKPKQNFIDRYIAKKKDIYKKGG